MEDVRKFEYYGWDDGTALYHFGIPGQKWGVRIWQNADGSFNEEGKIRYGRVSLSERRKAKFQNPDGSYHDKGKRNNYKVSKKEMDKAWAIYNQRHYGEPHKGITDELRDLFKERLSKTDLFKQIASDELTQRYVSVAKQGNELKKYENELYDKYEDKARNICKRDWNKNKEEYMIYGYRNFDDYWKEWGYHELENLVWEDKKYNKLMDDYYSARDNYGTEKDILKSLTEKYYGDGSIDRLNRTRPEEFVRNLIEDMAK